ncbi:MAG: Fumarate hydratase class II [Chlamydiia bacterium]|nr:Fumarate hydratase class II [Chlamydiia bacterium]
MYREEKDTLGVVKVPSEMLYGAQTARSLENFKVGGHKMPIEVVYALALIKKSTAIVNCDLKLLSKDKCELICFAADEILAGRYKEHFPLVVWQTGSGTQSNMNVNEVIANLANIKNGGELGVYTFIHPNDDVNKSQSSNDVVPSASVISSVMLIKEKLIPALELFQKEIEEKVKEFDSIVKCGRTHLMDATPLTLGQEFSAFAEQIKNSIEAIKEASKKASFLALGGTAVGTGINTHPKYADKVAKEISKLLDVEFKSAPNKFEALGCMDGLVAISGTLRTLACSFMKIGNDIRLLASGPRCGLGELNLPSNEPGSSIMPGKVNPTQCEMLTQVAAQVIGNDAAVGVAGMSGQLQLNVFRPVLIYNLLESIHLLADAAENFTHKCLKGISANEEEIQKHLEHSLMLVTALNPHIGYDNAASIAKKAFSEGKTLMQAAIDLDLLNEEEFVKLVDPIEMTKPK